MRGKFPGIVLVSSLTVHVTVSVDAANRYKKKDEFSAEQCTSQSLLPLRPSGACSPALLRGFRAPQGGDSSERRRIYVATLSPQ